MRERSVGSLMLCAIAAGVGGALLAVPSCGARTGLPIPPLEGETCVISDAGRPGSDRCDGGTTSISGTVYDPAGKQPLYGVVVYVPSSTPQPLAPGASCDSCNQLYTGNPVAATLTDADGHFTLEGVPEGADIPLVLQIGKWRRQLTVAGAVACQDNPQPDRSLTLPRNRAEGDLPSIAVSTGAADTLECLFVRVGIDPAEYGGGAGGPGSIHIFHGGPMPTVGPLGPTGIHAVPDTNPPAPESAAALWDSDEDIFRYDMVFLSCEGQETPNMNRQVLFDYAAAGGRVFASHFHYSWFNAPPFGQSNLATWTRGGNGIGNVNAVIREALPNGDPFPQGVALAHWLDVNGALTNGELYIEAARHNADVGPSDTLSQPWIVADQDASVPGATEYFSFNTPFGAAPADQCGQVVYTDIHVGGATGDDPTQPVPAECADVDLSAQEKALEFMLFNLSSCVTPPGQTQAPPPVCVPSKH